MERARVTKETQHDVVIIGGGPAGSTCARFLVAGGLSVLVLDCHDFPRTKLCAGWLSEPVWRVLGLRPEEYPRRVWRWNQCHVSHQGARHTVKVSGYFIRRDEFDDFLLRSSGAQWRRHRARQIGREGGGWVVDGRHHARYLVGAGGTHCPVARGLFPPRRGAPVGTREREFDVDALVLAACGRGNDGEPELLLHDDLSGYSWSVPKTDALNVGCGTREVGGVLAAWRRAREHLEREEHVPRSSRDALDSMKGHTYHLYRFDRARVGAHPDGAFLVGDALGLAHPLTAEGILPAVLSGRLCAEAVLAGAPDGYRERLEGHPILRDYRAIQRTLDAFDGERVPRIPVIRPLRRLVGRATAVGFAHLFSGAPLPGRRLLHWITSR